MPFSRASFKAVYEIIKSTEPLSGGRRRIYWKLVERSNSFYYFIQRRREKILGFIRLNTNDEQTAGWIGTVWIHLGTRIKDMGLRLSLIEKFSTITQSFVYGFQDKGMVAFIGKMAIIRPILSLKRVWIWSI